MLSHERIPLILVSLTVNLFFFFCSQQQQAFVVFNYLSFSLMIQLVVLAGLGDLIDIIIGSRLLDHLGLLLLLLLRKCRQHELVARVIRWVLIGSASPIVTAISIFRPSIRIFI